MFAFAVLVAAAAVAGWFFLSVKRPPRAITEIEPNDRPDGATHLSPGQVATGELSHRARGSDRDAFRIRISDGPARLLRVDVVASDGLDLQFEVTSETGTRLCLVDNVGPSGTEVIPNLTVDGGAIYFIAVSEAQGNTPRRDGAPQPYRIDTSLTNAGPNLEGEPNDTPEKATRLRVGLPMLAFSSSRDDVDCYAVANSKGGSVSGEASGLAGVDLVIEVHGTRQAAAPLVVDDGGMGEPERFTASWLEPNAPLFCVRRKAPVAGGPSAGDDIPALHDDGTFATPHFVLSLAAP